MKWNKTNEIKKRIENIGDIERAKDLNRLESQKLRKKIEHYIKKTRVRIKFRRK